jgi:hypothetical protein
MCVPASKASVAPFIMFVTPFYILHPLFSYTIALQQIYTSKFMNSYEESREANPFGSPRAFISSSNCEYELSGRVLKSSSRSSFGPIGDVGGVEKGFD